MKTGILYIANENYLDEAVTSAKSVRENTDLPIGVITDSTATPPIFDETITVDMSQWDWDVRIQQFHKTPFDTTLYLDTDTFVCGDIGGVFELLEEFDIAAAHAPIRHNSSIISEEVPEDSVPNAFPEFNCGVIAFNQSARVSRIFDNWLEIFRSHRELSSNLHDQPAFRQAVYESDARIATLPPEYNVRLPFPGYVNGNVKIIHGTADNYRAIADKLNSTKGPRIFNGEPVDETWGIELGPKKSVVYLQTLKLLAKERGLKGVLRRILNKIRKNE